MPCTGIIFVPSNPATTQSSSTVTTLLSNLTNAFACNPLPPWELTHRLCFDTSSLLPAHAPPRRYMHFLNLSRYPGRTFLGCSSRTGATSPPSVITIPSGPQTEDFFQTVTKKMEPLWAYRTAYKVEAGAGFEVTGMWEVRVGELKQGGTGQGPRVKGTVVEVVGLSDDAAAAAEKGVEAWEAMVRQLWDAIGKGVGGMRIMGGGVEGEGPEQEGWWLTLSSQWMTVLQMR
ncbi:MAG: hypothetical protein Q9227_003100 [Pyrenula ochraceoflavens]